MKKLVISLLLALATIAGAEVYTVSVTLTNTQPITYYSLPVSGWLDKIEFLPDTASTTTVTVATYGGAAGTTAIDTYATKAGFVMVTQTATVFRTRVIGTTTAGVALAGETTSVSGGATTSSVVATTALIGRYEKPMIGGNAKLALTGTANDGSCPVVVSLYYEPLSR